MFKTGHDNSGRRIFMFGRTLRPLTPEETVDRGEDWVQAKPAEIGASLDRARALPSGGWYVLGASRRITGTPTYHTVNGRELVAWRADGVIRVAPNKCPHMGGPLSAGRVHEGRLVCPWHGLELCEKRHGRWVPMECHDDGILTWVRPDRKEKGFPEPILPVRPSEHLDAVISMPARCDPTDVIVNRMDPWHGAHFHPHSFARLRVLRVEEDVLTVRVAFRILGPVCVEVDCTFHCPEPRTIVMTIIDGEGAGSIVETHATPMVPGWSMITELTLATSARPGFRKTLAAAPLYRPFIERSARRLWTEDAAYAERTYYLRKGGKPEPNAAADWSKAPGEPRRR